MTCQQNKMKAKPSKEPRLTDAKFKIKFLRTFLVNFVNIDVVALELFAFVFAYLLATLKTN